MKKILIGALLAIVATIAVAQGPGLNPSPPLPANAVAITGGTINGTPIGGTTPAAGAFTTLSATGATALQSTLTLNNNTAYLAKDSGGTGRALLLLDGANDLYIGPSTGSSGAFIYANGASRISISSAGAVTIAGTLASGTLAITGTLTASAIAAAAGNELLCYNTTGGVVTYAATVLGCVPSGLQFKNVAGTIDPQAALASLLNINPGYGTFKDTKTFGEAERVWLFADEVCDVDERLCKRDKEGRPENYDKYGTVAYLVAAMKAQQQQIDALRASVNELQDRKRSGNPADPGYSSSLMGKGE